MRLLVQHQSSYLYDKLTALGPHVIRLRPAPHTRARIDSYRLEVRSETQTRANLRWQQDPQGNRVARATFDAGAELKELVIQVELALELIPVNPFDFFLEEYAERLPFEYPPALSAELAPYRALDLPALRTGERFQRFAADLPRDGAVVPFLTAYNQAVNQNHRYVIRDEAGIFTPEETLTAGRGSCRDFAVLLLTLLRQRGLAARFASGYLIQLKDEGMLPDEPRGVSRDVVDLHAWAEVFLPGAGWVGLDATSGLWCGEGHIPLACTADPALASPVEGTASNPTREVRFSMTVGRLDSPPRPTAPFSDAVWDELLQGADRADAVLTGVGLKLTSGGEPTFVSREHPDLPEWNGAALGESKWHQGLRLTEEVRQRLARGAAVLHRPGKHYPGESLPRWTLELCARRDGRPLWNDDLAKAVSGASLADARRFSAALAKRLELGRSFLDAYEDPWRFLQTEAQLPVDVDPLTANVSDPEERRRLARVLDRGIDTPAGFVLPLSREAGRWTSERWEFRRDRLYLLPGDGSLGLRLPLDSLGPTETVEWEEAPLPKPDPRRPKDDEPEVKLKKRTALLNRFGERRLRTALTVEARADSLCVFLPPLTTERDFIDLVEAIDSVRASLDLHVLLEGYPPPPGTELTRFAVTPDPGVLEVNISPSRSGREHAKLLEQVFDAALHAGLHSEKFLLDGRVAGSGGGHHVTVGGPSPLESPFLVRPDLLASLITFVQHHPSLSYLFSGLFIGPTSQAPRVDEARHDGLYELELALDKAFTAGSDVPPWLTDALFRHLLVDVTGNTHRAELCLDKLFDWRTAHGRQGLVELRAFEMPPHPRMAAAQALLARSLVAAFAKEPFRGPLIRWGTQLHDRFMLPHALWRDFSEVIAHLDRLGIGIPLEAFRAFVELRCPLVGRLEAPGVLCEVRNALEPWHVLGEEATQTGTSRYVDSSVERVEVRAEGFLPERHVLLVNGLALPLRPTGVAGERAAGVRFRAWAPPHSLHPHLGIHHPLHLELVDRSARRGLAGGAYHVWHPEGRAFDTPPLTLAEASARRHQRFTEEGTRTYPIAWREPDVSIEAPFTLDLRRFAGDHPV